jgi:hypothetical protein
MKIDFWLAGLSASLTGVFKVHDVPAICASAYYKCDDFCTMKVPSEYGKVSGATAVGAGTYITSPQ